jgi:hypothetical protein
MGAIWLLKQVPLEIRLSTFVPTVEDPVPPLVAPKTAVILEAAS